MKCPLLAAETKKIAQKHRDQLFRGAPAPRDPPRPQPPQPTPAVRPPGFPPRPSGPPRFGESRRYPTSVHAVEADPNQPEAVACSPVVQSSEKDAGDA
jgi:hypothetical protein